MPIGSVTRGTTSTNRLRRVDRWISQLPALRRAASPLVVDLGFGGSATTTLELYQRLSLQRSDVRVVGVEIEPARVARAWLSARVGVSFVVGGFEVPLPGDRGATVIRAFNVLRQYDEQDVLTHWKRMVGRLDDGGVLVEGTCNELGRVASWVALTGAGPASFTISLRLAELERPSEVAARLPKVLIHRNVPGERIHRLLGDLDRHWQLNSALSVYAPSQRFVATVQGLRADGWPVLGSKARWRLGEVTVGWTAVSPLGFGWS